MTLASPRRPLARPLLAALLALASLAAAPALAAPPAPALQSTWDQRFPPVKVGTITTPAHLDPQGLVTGQRITDDTVGGPAIQRGANEPIAMGRYPTFGDEPADVTFSMSVGPAKAGGR